MDAILVQILARTSAARGSHTACLFAEASRTYIAHTQRGMSAGSLSSERAVHFCMCRSSSPQPEPDFPDPSPNIAASWIVPCPNCSARSELRLAPIGCQIVPHAFLAWVDGGHSWRLATPSTRERRGAIDDFRWSSGLNPASGKRRMRIRT